MFNLSSATYVQVPYLVIDVPTDVTIPDSAKPPVGIVITTKLDIFPVQFLWLLNILNMFHLSGDNIENSQWNHRTFFITLRVKHLSLNFGLNYTGSDYVVWSWQSSMFGVTDQSKLETFHACYALATEPTHYIHN